MTRRRPLTPEERARKKREMEGKIHALRRIADPNYSGQAATQTARQAAQAKLEAEVDPAGTLDPATRRRKANALRQARFTEGKLARLEGRPARKITAGEAL